MVRRRTAREVLGEKTSLRQCIRPLGGDISPGHDEFRCVPVLTSRSVVGDHYRYQVAHLWCQICFRVLEDVRHGSLQLRWRLRKTPTRVQVEKLSAG
jgi:hypothetical protein